MHFFLLWNHFSCFQIYNFAIRENFFYASKEFEKAKKKVSFLLSSHRTEYFEWKRENILREMSLRCEVNKPFLRHSTEESRKNCTIVNFAHKKTFSYFFKVKFSAPLLIQHFSTFPRHRTKRMPPTTWTSNIHTLPDFGARKRVSLQSLSHTQKTHRNCTRTLSHRATN